MLRPERAERMGMDDDDLKSLYARLTPAQKRNAITLVREAITLREPEASRASERQGAYFPEGSEAPEASEIPDHQEQSRNG